MCVYMYICVYVCMYIYIYICKHFKDSSQPSVAALLACSSGKCFRLILIQLKKKRWNLRTSGSFCQQLTLARAELVTVTPTGACHGEPPAACSSLSIWSSSVCSGRAFWPKRLARRWSQHSHQSTTSKTQTTCLTFFLVNKKRTQSCTCRANAGLISASFVPDPHVTSQSTCDVDDLRARLLALWTCAIICCLVVELYTLQLLNQFCPKATRRALWEHSGLNCQTAWKIEMVPLLAKTDPLALLMGSQEYSHKYRQCGQCWTCGSIDFELWVWSIFDTISDTFQVSGHLLGPEKSRHGQSEKLKCLKKLDKSQKLRREKQLPWLGVNNLFSESKLANASVWLGNPSRVSCVCILFWCFACL